MIEDLNRPAKYLQGTVVEECMTPYSKKPWKKVSKGKKRTQPGPGMQPSLGTNIAYTFAMHVSCL